MFKQKPPRSSDELLAIQSMIEFAVAKGIPHFKWGDFECTIPPMPDPEWYKKMRQELNEMGPKYAELNAKVNQLLLAKEFKK